MKSRRDFLKGVFLSPLLISGDTVLNFFGEKINIENKKGRVVVVKSNLYNRFNTNRDICKKIVEEGLKTLLDSDSGVETVKKLFNKNDVVGIKINTLGGRHISPTPQLVYALTDFLVEAGISPDNIIIWDRSSRELRRAGYKINNGSGIKCFGTNSLINGYDRELSFAGSVGSCFSKIISTFATAIINIGVLKDHDFAGISGALKNFYGAIHNPNKYHDNNCSPYVAELNTHPYIRKKLRLNIIDAPDGLYDGGPGYNPNYVFNFRGVIFSLDEVAIDSICLDIIERERKQNGKISLEADKRYPKWLDVAEKLGLGERNISLIRKVERKV